MTDLLTRFLPHLDKHLALGLLGFYLGQGLDVEEAYNAMLAKTSVMAGEKYEQRIADATAKAKPALDHFFNIRGGSGAGEEGAPQQPEEDEEEEKTYQLRLSAAELDAMRAQGELSFEYLKPKYGIGKEAMHAVYELAYLYYDKGSYINASELLSLCYNLNGFGLPRDKVAWGRLVCDTAAANYSSAKVVANAIRNDQNGIEGGGLRPTEATPTRARVWLLHWVLFPFFKGGAQYPPELFLWTFGSQNIAYRQAIETACPHLVRYVCAASLLNPSHYRNISQPAEIAGAVAHLYSDALTRSICAIRSHDLELALELLPEVKELVEGDFFLSDFAETLLDRVRRLIFMRYIATHSRVSIALVAERLQVGLPEAEMWIAELVSESKQRAKVDSVKQQLLVEPQTRPIEQKVLDKLDAVIKK